MAHHSNVLGSKNIRIKIAFFSVQCAKIISNVTKKAKFVPFKQTFEICRFFSEGAAARANWAESDGCVDSISSCLRSLFQHAVWPTIAVRWSVKKLFLQGVSRTVNLYLAAEGAPWHSSSSISLSSTSSNVASPFYLFITVPLYFSICVNHSIRSYFLQEITQQICL